jgi:hypothetical protein
MMYRWDDWRKDARGKIKFHNETCRWATKVLTEMLANAISKHVSKISSTDVEEANNEEGLGSVQTKSQLQRALQAINDEWNGFTGCKSMMTLQELDARTNLSQLPRTCMKEILVTSWEEAMVVNNPAWAYHHPMTLTDPPFNSSPQVSTD